MLPAANHHDVGLRLISTGGFDLLCEHLQTQWLENLGVEITWNQIEWGRFYDRKPEETPHMWMVGWYTDYPDPDDFLRIQWWVDPGWKNHEYDRLVEGAHLSAHWPTDQPEKLTT